MINLEKMKQKVSAPRPPFKKTCPWTILPLPRLNFSDSPLREEVIKIYSHPLKMAGGVRTMCLCVCSVCIYIVQLYSLQSKHLSIVYSHIRNICKTSCSVYWLQKIPQEFSSYLPVKFANFLKSRLIFNIFYCY